MQPVDYRVVPRASGFFSVVDEQGNIVSEGEDIRNYREAIRFAQDHAKQRGRTVNVVTPKEGRVEPVTGPMMLYSAASLRLVDEFTDRIGNFLKRSALDRAKQQGRPLITDEDISAVIDHLGWSIPDVDI